MKTNAPPENIGDLKQSLFDAFIRSDEKGICALDADGVVTFWTDGAARLTGRPEAEALGKPFEEAFPPRFVEILAAPLKAALTEKLSFLHRTKLIQEGGQAVPFHFHLYSIAQGLGLVFHETHSLAALKEHLEQYELRYLDLLRNVPESLVVLDSELRYSFINRAFEEEAGVSAAQALGRRCSEVFPDLDPRLIDLLRRTLETGESFEEEFPMPMGGDRRVCRVIGRKMGEELTLIMVDLTELRRVERELVESKERYRQIVENTHDFIWVMNADERITFINWEWISGYHRSEVLARGRRLFVDLYPPESYRTMNEAVDEVLKKNRSVYNLETIHVRKGTGEHEHYLTNLTPIEKEGGAATGVLGISREVSEQVKSQLALKLSEQKHREVAENITDVVIRRNVAGKITYVTPSVMTILGYQQDEFVEYFEGIITDSVLNERYNRALKKARAGERLAPYILEIWHKSGVKLLFEMHEAPVKGDDGQVAGIIGVMRDVTEREQAEDELKEKVKELTCLLDIGHVIDRYRKIGDILPEIVRAMRQGLHYPEKAHGRVIIDGEEHGCCNHDELPVRYSVEIVIEGRRRGELSVLSREELTLLPGEKILIEAIAGRVGDVVVRNELGHKVKRKEELGTMGSFVHVLTHEIRNPLNAIKLNLMLLKKRLDRMGVGGNSDNIDENMSAVLREIERLDNLLEEYRVFWKEGELKKTSFTLGNLAEEVEKLKGKVFQRYGIRFVTEVEEDVKLRADRTKLLQALIHLVNNAVEATEKDGTITLRARRDGPNARIEVEDTGTGIENIEGIFDPFITTKPYGTGMGLAVTRETLRRHGGNVEVESQQGEGSRFILTLPLGEPD